MEKLFQIKEHGSTPQIEVLAGVTTFFTMAYILFVNPQILAQTGMNPDGVFIATIIASVIGTLMMAFIANVPYALAPGMGLNAFFTFTVCMAMGFTWQEALALVLICGVFNAIITFTKLRKMIIKAMPPTLQSAVSGGIGMFIAYIGIKDAGLLKFTADSPFQAIIPDNVPASEVFTVVGTSSGTVPGLATFANPAILLALFGLVLMIILLVKKVRGAIFIGIVVATVVGILIDLTGILSTPLTGINDVSLTAEGFRESVSGIKDTAFHIDFKGLFSGGLPKMMLALTAAIGFILTDVFDCIGTFIGTGRRSGIFDDEDMKRFNEGGNFSSRMDRALVADLTATITGSFVGTSNTTVYVESSAGIAVGGRTGFSSVITAGLFAVCIFLAPLMTAVPSSATAPALIVVGVMMMSAFSDINWKDFEEAAPAFLCAVMMPLSYGITNGIAFGFISYCIIKVARRKVSEVHPIVWGSAALFILNFIMQAVYRL
ncbi:MAG: NCS2 family permease [Clostridiales Family XIII bacterium]|jgi:AGZA family xanthine/uracil permease-like MFS transporter|nr:NCS2 family permease [Clostridiales Family XIII bacterium]